MNELGEEVVGKSDFIDEGQTKGGKIDSLEAFFMKWSAQRVFKERSALGYLFKSRN